MPDPERQAREEIDQALILAGWNVQDQGAIDLVNYRGVAVREFSLKQGHGRADYLLFVDEKAVGVIEAKEAGATLSGVEHQTAKYAEGYPDNLPAPVRPLPFLYQSTGKVTKFTNLLDPIPRARRLTHFHRPETIAEWMDAPPGQGDSRPSSLRGRLRHLPDLQTKGFWPPQFEAIKNLERSLADNRTRSLIQMATGSGKTYTAISAIYRMIKFGGARRILFLVDRTNLGEQAEKEFANFVTPDDGRKFTELYNVQLMRSNKIDPVCRVVITTIQRLYSMLKGEEELDPNLEEGSVFDTAADYLREPVNVVYNPKLPVEYFDVMFVDECHRSIYTLWFDSLVYFDAFIIGLTATPETRTFAFFEKNLVMEYGHKEAVADGVNVDFEVFKIRTEVTEDGVEVEANEWGHVRKRDRATREERWDQADDDLCFKPNAVDRDVVVPDQIRTVVRAFRDNLPVIFPGRDVVPKTIIFAKSDSHAEDIVKVVREEFGKGNDFCQKITYRTTGKKPQDLIQEFRVSYDPRIAVTVDMIATGTDIRPVEIVMFMRQVKSLSYFEQMKGRGVRVIGNDDLIGVTPDAEAKTHFVLVDCVGVCENVTQQPPLERKRTVSLKKLLDMVAVGNREPDVLASLAGRFARLEKLMDQENLESLQEAAGGKSLPEIAQGIVQALDDDNAISAAREDAGMPESARPTEEQIEKAQHRLLDEAAKPIAGNPEFRQKLIDHQRVMYQVMDREKVDVVREAGFSADAKEKAQALTASFRKFIEDNHEEISALEVLYTIPYRKRPTFKDIKDLSRVLSEPSRGWTKEQLWHAYETLHPENVKKASGKRLLTDLVSLVRHALDQDPVLTPYTDTVHERFEKWIAAQETAGRAFTLEQREWLAMIVDHVGASLQIEPDDFDDVPFNQKGGYARAFKLFGKDLPALLRELNEVLVA